MKRIIIVLLAIFLLSLTSCNNNNTVQIETKYYNVKFYNYDESLLYETEVEEGKNILYPYDNPTREEDLDYTYTFIGWDKNLDNIKSNLVIYAVFEAKDKGFSEIVWF